MELKMNHLRILDWRKHHTCRHRRLKLITGLITVEVGMLFCWGLEN
jgi:hypothetical protein